MKKLIILLLLIVSTVIPCVAEGQQEKGQETEQKTVQFFISGKSVWGEPMEAVVAKFNNDYPNIKVEYEVVGGGADYHPILSARARTNNLPDIFMISGAGDFEVWGEFLEDLSDMDVVDHFLPVASDSAYYDGKLMGLPTSIEGYGYIYNKKLFAQAGIANVPQTFSQLENAVKKLQSANITPFCSGYGTWWVISNHQLNIPFAIQKNPVEFVDGLSDGTESMAGNKYFQDFKKLLNLVKSNTSKQALTEDHHMQVSLFAGEKVAMIQQGNWKEAAIMDANSNIDMGLVPLAITEDPAKSGCIPVGIPWYFVVSKESAVKEEAKIFLNWLLNEANGQEQLVTSLNSIPAYDHFSVKLAGGISSDILEYSKEGKTIPWVFPLWPKGFTQNAANVLQSYVADKITYEEALEALDKEWKALTK